MKRVVKIENNTHIVSLFGRVPSKNLSVDGIGVSDISLTSLGNHRFRVRVGKKSTEITLAVQGDDVFIKAFGRTFMAEVLDPVEQAHAASSSGDLNVTAPMPGLIVELHVEKDAKVFEGQSLLTIESMKLLTVLKAGGDGIVEKIYFSEGEAFNKGAILMSLGRNDKEEDHA